MKKILFMLCCVAVSSMVHAQKWHIMPTQQEIDFRNNYLKKGVTRSNKVTATTGVMPADARYPGEFEESQAVVIAWPYEYDMNSQTWYPDTVASSAYAQLYGKLAHALQQEAKLWVRVDDYPDTNVVLRYMTSLGTPLTNYRFFIHVSDAFWTRDYGPLGFYYSNNDSLGFLEMNYYPGRPNDDAFAEFLGDQMSYKNVKSGFYSEGGNYMTDGFGRTFHSSRINLVNTTSGVHTPTWTNQQVLDTLQYAWAADSIITTPELLCDGGTGHIDMYLKLLDEQTFAIMEYPTVVTAVDKATINTVITMLSSKTSVYNRPYRVIKMPMPTRNNGTVPTLCGQIDADARTYVNGLLLNKTYFMPVYSNTTSGNKAGDSVAIDKFKKALPGYNIVPIDSRDLTILGGALHCITMQIPAENPIRFWHPSIVDLQPLNNRYHIIAKITNKSGIAHAVCYWRKKGTATWNNVNLTDSAGYMTGYITGGFTATDEVEYYLSATSNNGKTMSKPMTAPAGFYNFYFQAPNNINQLDPDKNFVLNPLPNPNNGAFYLPVSLEQQRDVKGKITDVLGKTIAEINFGKLQEGMNRLEFDLYNSPSGIYFIQLTADGNILATKKVIKE